MLQGKMVVESGIDERTDGDLSRRSKVVNIWMGIGGADKSSAG